MSLFEDLLAQPRARTRVTIPRPGTEAATAAWQAAGIALIAARQDGADQADLDELQEQLVAATADLKALGGPRTVEFQALLPDEFERLRATYTTEEGTFDREGMRPVLLAACCLDESLQDPARWTTLITSGALTHGHVDSLWVAAYNVNADPLPFEVLAAGKD